MKKARGESGVQDREEGVRSHKRTKLQPCPVIGLRSGPWKRGVGAPGRRQMAKHLNV
jgi:hypothetical protein